MPPLLQQPAPMKESTLLLAIEFTRLPHAAPPSWSRRQFLRAATVAGVAAPFFLSCRHARSLHAKPISANSKLNHACIGVGGMGWVDLQNFLQHPRVQIVALCDVDANNLDQGGQGGARRPPLLRIGVSCSRRKGTRLTRSTSPCPTIRTSPLPTARSRKASTSIARSPCATTSPRCARSPRPPIKKGRDDPARHPGGRDHP